MIFAEPTKIFLHMGNIYANQLPTMAALAGSFTILSLFRSQTSSPGNVWWRNPGLRTDLCNAIVNAVLAPYFRITYLVAIYFIAEGVFSNIAVDDFFTNGGGPLRRLPFAGQAIVYLLLSDLMAYWIHRTLHFSTLWKYHAIHHSATQVDWTTAYRNHPINLFLQQSFIGVTMIFLGVSPEVMVFLVPWDVFSAALVHSNVKWSFGWLKYIIATPVFHRWHHGLPEDGGNNNFAPTFAFWDLLFGTFYMPDGRLPKVFGVDEPDYPESYFKQLVRPFKQVYAAHPSRRETPNNKDSFLKNSR
jgi:sterol desaturase/sphingolipid hydroxylase (fatty acid hydroxylase superfamily)